MKMLRLGFVLALCLYGALAYRVDYELEGMDKLWSRGGVPGPAGGNSNACKKDIWILWDNSQSVGLKGFKDRIRPFIKNLIKSPRLNVGPKGTHIGIITFATQEKTRVLLELGAKQTEAELLNFLDGLDYNRDLNGDGTRTGMAFKIADEKFNKPNPKNYRSDVDDVVLLFTDGQPVRRRGEDQFDDRYRGNKGERLLTKDRADNLKSRGITVVGLAVGLEERIRPFREAMQSWVSTPVEKYYYEAKLEKMDSVLDELISASCVDPGLCKCDTIEVDQTYSAQGEKALISWPKPELSCETGLDPKVDSMVVEPSVSSPAEFGVGKHTITYTYAYQRGPNIAKQECLVVINIQDCHCPQAEHVEQELQAGETKAQVSWTVPKPNCPVTLKSVSRPGAEHGNGRFAIGDYHITYAFKHRGHSGSFRLQCPVNVSVRGQMCGGVAIDETRQDCCCGKIYDRQANHQCCGYQYYDNRAQSCSEKGFTLMDRN